MIVTVTMTQSRLISHLIGESMTPMSIRMLFAIPFLVAKIKAKIIPEMDVLMMVGIKYIPRKRLDPFMRIFSSTAISSDNGIIKTNLYAAYSNVCPTLLQKVLSPSILVILRVPVKVAVNPL